MSAALGLDESLTATVDRAALTEETQVRPRRGVIAQGVATSATSSQLRDAVSAGLVSISVVLAVHLSISRAARLRRQDEL
jgi:hypothetical protein